MTRNKRLLFHARRIAGLGVLAFCTGTWADNAPRVEASLDLGYDDNPAQRPHGEPLGFARYGVAVGRELAGNDDLWSLEMLGHFQDYEGASDNHRLELALGWRRSLDQGKSALLLSLDGVLYRDRLVAADERDEAGMTVGFQRLVSAEVELKGSAEIRWLGYRNPSLPWGGRPGGAAANGFGSPKGPGMRPGPTPHDDHWRGVSGEVGYYPQPDMVLTLRAHYGRLNSSSAPEEYDQYGAGLFMVYRPAPDWTLELSLEGYDRRYDQNNFHLQRQDTYLSTGLRVQRDWEEMTFHLALTRTDNDSSIRQKSFQQTVTESGVAWYF
jgi:hypothetical protein